MRRGLDVPLTAVVDELVGVRGLLDVETLGAVRRDVAVGDLVAGGRVGAWHRLVAGLRGRADVDALAVVVGVFPVVAAALVALREHPAPEHVGAGDGVAGGVRAHPHALPAGADDVHGLDAGTGHADSVRADVDAAPVHHLRLHAVFPRPRLFQGRVRGERRGVDVRLPVDRQPADRDVRRVNVDGVPTGDEPRAVAFDRDTRRGDLDLLAVLARREPHRAALTGLVDRGLHRPARSHIDRGRRRGRGPHNREGRAEYRCCDGGM